MLVPAPVLVPVPVPVPVPVRCSGLFSPSSAFEGLLSLSPAGLKGFAEAVVAQPTEERERPLAEKTTNSLVPNSSKPPRARLAKMSGFLLLLFLLLLMFSVFKHWL